MLEMNWHEQIISSLQRIEKVCTCSSCGANEVSDDFECVYCRSTNEQLKEELEKFSQILGEYSENQLNDPFVVVSLKNLGNNLRFVSSFTNEEVEKAYLTWAKRILSEEITDLDYDAILNLFDGSQIHQEPVVISIQNKILMETATQQKQYPYELVSGALSHVFYQSLKTLGVKDCTINFGVLDENVNGEAGLVAAIISEDEVRNFIATGDTSVINTIGHEACHIYQNYKRTRNIVENKYDLFMMYDHLVRCRHDDFYDDNYYKQFIEIDARINGSLIEERFLEGCGLTMQDNSKIQQAVDCALWLESDTSRIIEGEEVELEEEVLTILNDEPDFYDHFPQFRYEFVRDGDEIRWKTRNELLDDYVLNVGSTKGDLYFELIKRANTREKRLEKESNIVRSELSS